MSFEKMSPQLISKIKRINNHDIEAMGLLAEVAEDIRDPTLRTLITSIIGDENGHVRFFKLLLSSATIIPVRTRPCKTYSLNLKKSAI
jgi:rubrerythrin